MPEQTTGAETAHEQDPNSQQAQGETPSFDAWLEAQDEQTKSLLDTHTSGLKSALTKERESRKTLEKQIADMASKLEEGSEARQELETISGQLEAENRRADFYEAASGAGVRNLKLAWIVAQADDLFDRRGAPDFAALKESYPELFGVTKAPAGNAGAGGGEQPQTQNMNDFIRAAAGRR